MDIDHKLAICEECEHHRSAYVLDLMADVGDICDFNESFIDEIDHCTKWEIKQ
jgi:hypothetical protein